METVGKHVHARVGTWIVSRWYGIGLCARSHRTCRFHGAHCVPGSTRNSPAIKYPRCVYHFGFMFTFTVTAERTDGRTVRPVTQPTQVPFYFFLSDPSPPSNRLYFSPLRYFFLSESYRWCSGWGSFPRLLIGALSIGWRDLWSERIWRTQKTWKGTHRSVLFLERVIFTLFVTSPWNLNVELVHTLAYRFHYKEAKKYIVLATWRKDEDGGGRIREYSRVKQGCAVQSGFFLLPLRYDIESGRMIVKVHA